MERVEIQQRLHNALGVILIDKAEIREDATLKDLALEESEIDELLDQLEYELGIIFPIRIKNRIHKAPDHLTLQILVDVIVVLMGNEKPP